MKKILTSIILAIFIIPSSVFADFDVSLKKGSRGDSVEELQTFLFVKDYYVGKIDGRYGPGTEQGVKKFQKANGLKADGSFGLLTRAKAKEATAKHSSFWEPQTETGSLNVAQVIPQVITDPVSEYQGARISFVEDAGKEKYCDSFGESIDGCYDAIDQNIYINNNPIGRPKDFVLYHEIGHHKFNKIFPASLFADREIMADQFGLWIMNQKYGRIASQTLERSNFFSSLCDQICVNEILGLQIPGVKYLTTTFEIRI